MLIKAAPDRPRGAWPTRPSKQTANIVSSRFEKNKCAKTRRCPYGRRHDEPVDSLGTEADWSSFVQTRLDWKSEEKNILFYFIDLFYFNYSINIVGARLVYKLKFCI